MPASPVAGSLADPDRLAATRAARLADTSASLDRLTQLVQRCLNVPISTVSLVESDRQVFASQQGLGEPWCSLGETPLSHSFCQHVVTLEEPLIIEDARTTPLVQDSLAIADGVIAYLGVPLRTPDGHTIGSLCAIDEEPRAWTAADLESMHTLADATMVAIGVRYRAAAEASGLDGAMSRSGALFRALLESAPATLVLRPTGAIAVANPAAAALTGRPAAALLGLRAWATLPVFGDAEDRLRDAVTCAANGETAELTIPLDDTPTALRVRPVADGDGLLLLEVVLEGAEGEGV